MYLTEIENRLATDRDGNARAQLMTALSELRDELALVLDTPLSPAQFRQARARIEGCDAAISVVDTLAERLRVA